VKMVKSNGPNGLINNSLIIPCRFGFTQLTNTIILECPETSERFCGILFHDINKCKINW
jgi:hypothetical protein